MTLSDILLYAVVGFLLVIMGACSMVDLWAATSPDTGLLTLFLYGVLGGLVFLGGAVLKEYPQHRAKFTLWAGVLVALILLYGLVIAPLLAMLDTSAATLAR